MAHASFGHNPHALGNTITRVNRYNLLGHYVTYASILGRPSLHDDLSNVIALGNDSG